jgi:ankyrin repeat protein
MVMKWFTPARVWGPDESESGYADHLESIRSSMSKGVAELAFDLHLHDARVVKWRAESDGSIVLVVIPASFHGEEYQKVTLRYVGAMVIEPESGDLGELDLLSGDIDLIDDEVDYDHSSTFTHRVIAWPSGIFALDFQDLIVSREPSTGAERHALFERAEVHTRPRILRDAWLEFEPPLVRAAALGAVDDIRRLLSEGTSPDEADDMGWSALNAAAQRGHLDICRMLVEAGATVDARTDDGSTPLTCSIGGSDDRVLRFLHDAGADWFGGKNDSGAEALDRAAASGDVAAARIFLDLGADINFTDENGYTPLMTAAENGDDAELVTFLLARGADPLRRALRWNGIEPETAAVLARLFKHERVAAILEAAESTARRDQ